MPKPIAWFTAQTSAIAISAGRSGSTAAANTAKAANGVAQANTRLAEAQAATSRTVQSHMERRSGAELAWMDMADFLRCWRKANRAGIRHSTLHTTGGTGLQVMPGTWSWCRRKTRVTPLI